MFYNFYNETIKRNLLAFSSLFDDINITLENGKTIRVPIHYSTKDKFVDVLVANKDLKNAQKNISLPVMGFEMAGLNYAPERMTNSLNKITKKNLNSDGTKSYAYNKVPYDINFDLYIATHRLADSFKIVEQILPYFTPEITIKILDNPELLTETNIHIVLTSASMSVENNDTMEDGVRVITWQLSFTMKSFLYSDVKRQSIITKSTIGISDVDLNNKFATISTFVDSSDGSIKETYKEYSDG